MSSATQNLIFKVKTLNHRIIEMDLNLFVLCGLKIGRVIIFLVLSKH